MRVINLPFDLRIEIPTNWLFYWEKKLFLVMLKSLGLILLLSVAITSCKKERSSNLLGKWNMDRMMLTTTTNGTIVGTSESVLSGIQIEFLDNGTGSFRNGAGQSTITYKLTNSERTLTVKYNSKRIKEYIIKSLSNSALVLVSDADFQVYGSHTVVEEHYSR